MAERGEVARIVADCVRYWRETGVPRGAIAEMRLELEVHLEAAAADGRPPSAVVGHDLASFAESWAAEYREAQGSPATFEAAAGRLVERREGGRRALAAYASGAVALAAAVVAGAMADGTGSADDAAWRWVWTIFALAMGVGEIFTAGFFLLPFAIGAGASAVLAWLDVSLIAQWLAFFGVSLVSLAYLRRFIERQDELDQPRVGANRWVDTRGIVLESIDPDTGSGLVRIDNEEWRATADSPIPTGAKVVVRDVRGARLVVVPLEDL